MEYGETSSGPSVRIDGNIQRERAPPDKLQKAVGKAC
jgi:hypothetical protein